MGKGRPNILDVLDVLLQGKKKIDETMGYLLILGMQAIYFHPLRKLDTNMEG